MVKSVKRPPLRGLLAVVLAAATIVFAGPVRAAGTEGAKPLANTQPAPDEPLRLIVSLAEQRIDVYRGDALVSSSNVSTGQNGYDTPSGVYSILQKSKWHRSNIYSAAPMPFMQRLTWSGIALHEGNVSRPYASHGCIRLPRQFAMDLFQMTGIGTDVIVVAGDARPQSIVHPALFQPSQAAVFASIGGAGELAADKPSPAEGASGARRLDAPVLRVSNSPLRILITRRTGRERLKDLQGMLAELGFGPGDIDGYMGPDTGRAIRAFQQSLGLQPTGMLSEDLFGQLYAAVGREEIAGHIYVRQDYVDLFDAPVDIRRPDAPLGTHVFAAGAFSPASRRASWTALTMTAGEQSTPAEALERIDIPADIYRRISLLLTPGTSLIVSDAGLGRETGKGTDFIVQP
ncbi:MAG: L,D-transpeptidase family protein [Flavobacteriaceae bacterium]